MSYNQPQMQPQMQSQPPEREVEIKPKSKKNRKKSEEPESEMVGNWIGFFVVSIVMNGLFFGVWWAIIPQIILFISAIQKTADYVKNRNNFTNYQYHTNQDDFVGMLIGAIIVNIVMSALFHGVWWAKIPSTILIIKTIETGYYFYRTNEQKSQKMRIQSPPMQAQYQPQPQLQSQEIRYPSAPAAQSYSNPTTYFVEPVEEQSIESEERYCPMCGTKRESFAKFCSTCGNSF